LSSTKRISRLNNDNDLLSSCVEDDGVLFDVFVDVDDGRGWARCERITDCIRDVWLVALVVRLSKSRCRDGEAMPSECRVSHKQINRLPAELPPPTKTQMHLTLKSCLPSMTLYIAMSGGSPPRLPRHTLERQQYKYKKDLPL